MSDQLIRLCQSGDRRAQRTLYDQFACRMFRVCFRYIKDELHAEDLMIRGFMKVFTQLPGFDYRSQAELEAWIKRIMVNESLMFLRQKHNFLLVDETYADRLETEVAVDAGLKAEEIYALILELPVGYRTVFNLFAIEGFSHREIAQRLGISENTSKSQLSKARAALRHLLIKYGITDAI